jgi:pantoate--beta-alanine ligase
MHRPVSPRGTGSDAPRVLRTVDELRAHLREAARAGSGTVGLVPTMGALHEGHLSLIRRARAQCDTVVVSLFVNPAQFEELADLERYPRDEARDVELAGGAGAEIVFAPDVASVYPEGFCTTVAVGGPADRLEGAVRGAGHFRGVATVVLKLLNVVAPDVAYFGQKDAQQALVVRRLVRDLDLAVRIEVCPTVREADGLALSSRNARLAPGERERATALSRGLFAAAALAADGERRAEALTGAVEAHLGEHAIDAEYVELADAETLEPLGALDRPALLLVAARLGSTRLIDNVALEPVPTTGAASEPRGARETAPARPPRTRRGAASPFERRETPAGRPLKASSRELLPTTTTKGT